MVEQWYAKDKITGEIFEHKGRYCFSLKGLETSIVNKYGSWYYSNTEPYDYSMTCSDRADSLAKWDFKRIDLT